ncbi:methyl-accepting chemotaxis protein [Bdellovibrio svalbardensis]|uniref:Methyl-accepting chemotaxis protein n=1 Tax=Bdellovibrio svalbardensis TaxID=2972972 RepID=A0ABT6DGK6_9BACT|nr:methyl-accepting chemotaxis protein [Bdellovibrio svalbardensis]MDG0815977.1 methyl-accepting chemotaxis protein [Bdellovibrio svalbardensis]
MKKLSLNAKVAFLVGFLISGSVIISAVGISKMSTINTNLDEITDRTAPRIDLDHRLKEIFLIQVINERDFVLEETAEDRKTILARLESRDKELRSLLEERKKVASEAGLVTIHDFQEAYEKWSSVDKEIIGFAQAGNNKDAIRLIMEKGRTLRLAVEEVINSSIDRNKKEMEVKKEASSATYQLARTTSIMTTALALLIGVFMSFFILRSLGKSISQVIDGLKDNSLNVTQASHQIASSSEGLSQASAEQAASLEETVSTLEELTSMVRVNSENAKQAAKLSEETRTIATKGEHEIRDLIVSMNHISSDSKKIEDIINVIDDIAFQTNLLALNAAVEAARAGEQGKGFAVVAEAVRNLAQRSSSAAKDITELIKGSVQKIETGSTQVSRSGEVLSEIVASAKKVSDLNAEIASASEEQSNGISQIGKAMNQLDQVTQINAATSEEAAASAQELSVQANQLTQIVDVLIFTIKGGNDLPESVSPVVAKNEAKEFRQMSSTSGF